LAATDTGATFFDTVVNAWSVGPRLQLTRFDTVAVLYQQSLINQTQTSGTGSQINTNTQSVTANYTREVPSWKFTVVGGVTLVEPASQAFPTGRLTISTNPERSTIFQVDLSRLAAPSFFLTAGALISNVAQIQITHRLEKHITLRGSANAGYNESIPREADTQFTNFTLSAGLNYRITKTFALDLYYDHNDFKTESPTVSYVMLRNLIGFSLTAEWR
jgi:opacity protein-like surface antigen